MVSFPEGLQDREQGGGLGGAALEAAHLQREPRRVEEQPDLDLRVDAALLARPDLAQRVFGLGLGLEAQGGDVVEDQPRRATTARPLEARRRRPTAVVLCGAPGQSAERRAQPRCGAPTSASTRTVSASEVGSTTRAHTIARNSSSARASNPSRA